MDEPYYNAMPEAAAEVDPKLTQRSAQRLERHYPGRPEVIYLYGACLLDLLQPESGLDALKLMEREGVRVVFPDQQILKECLSSVSSCCMYFTTTLKAPGFQSINLP